MKSQRSALLGLALGVAVLGMTACETKDEIIIPPAPNPVVVSLVPDALTLEVGGTGQLVAVVTGGEAGSSRDVNFTSSNTNVATVDGSGVVTAVAPGVATITARSVADANAADASAVTVVPDGGVDPGDITISIQSITRGALNVPVNINNVFGQIDVTLNVDPSPPAGYRIETLVDGTEVCSQSISSGSAGVAVNADPELGTLAQPIQIVCSFDTGAFDETTGVVSFEDGPHTVSAQVVGPDGAVVATVNTTLVFNNQNFIQVTAESSNGTATSANGPRSVAAAGSLWHGGDLTFTLLAVIYDGSNNNVANATVSLTTSGAGVNGLPGCQTTGVLATDPTISATDGGAGGAQTPNCGPATSARTVTGASGQTFQVTFPANALMAGTTNGLMNVEDVLANITVTSVTTGGQAGPVCINPDPAANPQPACGTGAGGSNPNIAFFANPIRVDNLAPRVAQLNIVRPNQYYNEDFVPAHAAGGATCPANVPCARTVDYGVDRQTEAGNSTFWAGPNTSSLVDVTAGFSPLPETQVSTTNLFAIRVGDALDNERTVYATATNTTVTTPNAQGTVPAGLRFGIDNTDPTMTTVGPPDLSTNCPSASGDPSDPNTTACTGLAVNGWVFSFSDAGVGPSGFNTNPVSVRIERILSTGVTCHHPDTGAAISCAANNNNGFVADDGNTLVPAADGYYRVTASVSDAAGNESTETVRLTLRDYTAPTAGGIASPAVITGGASTQFSSALQDNVDLGDILPATTFSDAAGTVLAEQRQSIGSYGPDAFNVNDPGAVTIAQFVAAVVGTSGAGLPDNTVSPASTFDLAARDVAGVQINHILDDGCPPAGSGQNCVLRQVDITAAIAAGTPTGGYNDYSALNTANAANGAHGLFVHQAPSNDPVCTLVTGNCAGTPAPPKNTTLTTTLTGPAGTFANPFNRVVFYVQDVNGRWQPIGTASVAVTDNTVLDTRTYTFTTVWTPAGLPAGAVQVMAVGIGSDGSALLSQEQTVNLIDS